MVGYWRSHTRPGLYLDQEDYSVILTYFSNPSQVFLLVKPSMGGQSVGGFFFWADGDIRRESPYEEFLFDQERLPAADHGIMSSPDSLPAADRGQHHASPSGYWNTSSSGTVKTRAIWNATSREGE